MSKRPVEQLYNPRGSRGIHHIRGGAYPRRSNYSLDIGNLRSANRAKGNRADLDAGEREAIALAEEIKADQILLDEAEARQEATRRKLPFIGALGVLRRAAQLDLIHLPDALVRLQQTTFYATPELNRSLLDEDAQRRDRR